ncbi:Regulator of the glycerol channel 1 [Yarrowia sp. B02]|nr:Regulator of the glycerol channel 1 [Yarrowia sp. B02]
MSGFRQKFFKRKGEVGATAATTSTTPAATSSTTPTSQAIPETSPSVPSATHDIDTIDPTMSQTVGDIHREYAPGRGANLEGATLTSSSQQPDFKGEEYIYSDQGPAVAGASGVSGGASAASAGPSGLSGAAGGLSGASGAVSGATSGAFASGASGASGASTSPTASRGQPTHALDAPTDPTNLLIARLDNWRATVAFLIEYVNIASSQQKHQVGYLEKTRKALSEVPRFDGGVSSEPGTPSTPTQSHGFQQSLRGNLPRTAKNNPTPTGVHQANPEAIGVTPALSNMATRLDTLINLATQAEQNLKTSVLPSLEELEDEIEKHIKTLKHSTLKQSQEVDKVRSKTHKSIETLGQSTAGFTGLQQSAKHDPYVLKRATLAQVGDQLNRENALSDSLLSVQNNIKSFERHIVQVIQRAVQLSSEILSGYYANAHDSYVSFSERFAAIPEDFEWDEFAKREQSQLVDPAKPKRSLDTVTFPNSDNPAAQPLVSGILQRKEGHIVKNYTSGFYVLTRSGFLHGYASEDPLIEPTPNFSLYVPDSTIGPLPPQGGDLKLKIKGKDTSSAIPTKKTITLKAATYQELQLWYDAFLKVSGGKTNFASADFEDEPEEVVPGAAGGQYEPQGQYAEPQGQSQYADPAGVGAGTAAGVGAGATGAATGASQFDPAGGASQFEPTSQYAEPGVAGGAQYAEPGVGGASRYTDAVGSTGGAQYTEPTAGSSVPGGAAGAGASGSAGIAPVSSGVHTIPEEEPGAGFDGTHRAEYTPEPIDPGFNAPAGGSAQVAGGHVTDHGALQGKYGDVEGVTHGLQQASLDPGSAVGGGHTPLAPGASAPLGEGGSVPGASHLDPGRVASPALSTDAVQGSVPGTPGPGQF